MFDMPQSGPPTAAATEIVRKVAYAALPAKCGTTSEDGDIVVCGRKSEDEQYRLRPLPALKSEPNFLYKPHVIKLGPLRVGLLGGAVGATLAF